MAKSVNHHERKREICATCIKLFAQRGYEDVNFGNIAKESGLSRKLVDTYFKDKRTNFNQAIFQLTTAVADKYRERAKSKQTADAKLRELCVTVFALLFDNRDFLCVIVDRLCNFRRLKQVPTENIMRHTLGFKRIVHSMIVEACHRGEYTSNLDANRATALVYSQFEAAILQLAVSGDATLSALIGQLNILLNSFKNND